MSEYTPGPWEASTPEPERQGPLTWYNEPWSISGENGQKHIANISTMFAAEEAEDRANARLIAAAPELLEACKRVLRAINWGYTEDRMSDDEQAALLSAAIAKATGA